MPCVQLKITQGVDMAQEINTAEEQKVVDVVEKTQLINTAEKLVEVQEDKSKEELNKPLVDAINLLDQIMLEQAKPSEKKSYYMREKAPSEEKIITDRAKEIFERIVSEKIQYAKIQDRVKNLVNNLRYNRDNYNGIKVRAKELLDIFKQIVDAQEPYEREFEVEQITNIAKRIDFRRKDYDEIQIEAKKLIQIFNKIIHKQEQYDKIKVDKNELCDIANKINKEQELLREKKRENIARFVDIVLSKDFAENIPDLVKHLVGFRYKDLLELEGLFSYDNIDPYRKKPYKECRKLENMYKAVQRLIEFARIWVREDNRYHGSKIRIFTLQNWIREREGAEYPYIREKLYESLLEFLKDNIQINNCESDVFNKLSLISRVLNSEFNKENLLKLNDEIKDRDKDNFVVDFILWYFNKDKDKAKNVFFASLSYGYFKLCALMIKNNIIKITERNEGKSIFRVIAEAEYDSNLDGALAKAIFDCKEDDNKKNDIYELFPKNCSNSDGINDLHALFKDVIDKHSQNSNGAHSSSPKIQWFQNHFLPKIPADILAEVLKKPNQEGNTVLHELVEGYNNTLGDKQGTQYRTFCNSIITTILEKDITPKGFKEIMEIENKDGDNILKLVAKRSDFMIESGRIKPQDSNPVIQIIKKCLGFSDKFKEKNERLDEEGNSIAVSILQSLFSVKNEVDMTVWHTIIK